MTIYIIDPRSGGFCTIERWRKEPDPTIAELVYIDGYNPSLIAIHKNILRDENKIPEKFAWEDAKEAVKKFRINTKTPNIDVAPFRLPTRRECLDVYDARFQGLDDALRLIGGDPLTDYWTWTGDEDPDPEYTSNYAFIFYGYNGGVYYYSKYNPGAVRPVVYIDPFQI